MRGGVRAPTMEAGAFRVSVSLERFFSDERARCYMAAEPARPVRWLARRLRRTFGLQGPVALTCRGHLLPPAEPLALLLPGDTVEAIPATTCVADLSREHRPDEEDVPCAKRARRRLPGEPAPCPCPSPPPPPAADALHDMKERALALLARHEGSHALADEVNHEVRDELEHEVRNEVHHEVRDELDHEVRNEVDHEVRDELEHEVRNEVDHEVRDELDHEVRNEVDHEARALRRRRRVRRRRPPRSSSRADGELYDATETKKEDEPRKRTGPEEPLCTDVVRNECVGGVGRDGGAPRRVRALAAPPPVTAPPPLPAALA